MALGNRGPIRFTADGRAPSRHRRGLLALRLLRLRGRAQGRRAGRHRARPARHPGPPAGRDAARRSTPRAGRRWAPTARRRTCSGRKPLGDPFGGTTARQRPPSGQDVRAARRRRTLPKEVVYPHPGLAAVLRGRRCASTAIPSCWPSPRRSTARTSRRSTRRCSSRSRAAAPRSPGTRTASTHWDSPDWDQGIARLQLHGPALWLHAGQRRLGRAGLAQAGQDRHRGAGGRGRHRAAARRRADDLRAGRRRHHQPPGAARLVRQHQPGLAGDGELRLPSPQVGAGRAGRRRPQRGRRSTTPSASASAPA